MSLTKLTRSMFAGVVEIERALRAGAQAYLLKSMGPEQMIATIGQVHAGKKRVQPEIAAQLAEHMSDQQLTNVNKGAGFRIGV